MAVDIPFNKNLEFEYGKVSRLSPLVSRVIANNPSAFTFYGTGTYIVGKETVAIIDPGPADQVHIDAILKAIDGKNVSHILVTHTHSDHSPGCALLQQHVDAKTYALGVHGQGSTGKVRPRDNTEFGADWDFKPDVMLKDGETLSSSEWSLTGLHTPGHATNHLSFYLAQENALFCGDAVMGWSTTIVSPPDGNMIEYMHTLELLLERKDDIYYPTHGAPIKKPKDFVRSLYDHRLEREQQILDCISSGLHTINDMLPVVYSELDVNMYPAAARSLLATIESMLHRDRLRVDRFKGESFYYLK